jgi:hypothetical protein
VYIHESLESEDSNVCNVHIMKETTVEELPEVADQEGLESRTRNRNPGGEAGP